MWMSNIIEASLILCYLCITAKKAGWLDGWMDAEIPFGGKHEARACLHTTAERLWFDIAMQMHAPSDKLPSHKSLPASLLTAWCVDVLLQQISCREYVTSRRFYAFLVTCNGD